jgi:hypothetical protein
LVQVPTLPGTAHDLQVPVQVPPQQTPCSQKPELHSGAPPHAAPIGFLPQLPLLQVFGAMQSASVMQIVRQRLSVAQMNGAQVWPAVVRQVPRPSHRKADVSRLLVHAISLQIVPAGYLSQAPVPSHMPVEPQVEEASTGHSSRGSVPSCAVTQLPTVPWPTQVRQVPVQAALQQTPSAQKPLVHSPPVVHALPSGLPGASMPTSPGRSTGVSAPPSYAASPGALSTAPSVLASGGLRCSPPPPQPASHATTPSVMARLLSRA